MFLVIFELRPKEGQLENYLNYAKELKPEIERVDGFIDNERFASRNKPGWLLSLSTWRDEKAIVRWRTLRAHHDVQEKGRLEVFADYHLRVGEITADTNVPPGQVLRQQRFDETETGAAHIVTLSEIAPARDGEPSQQLMLDETPRTVAGLVENDIFESIYNPGKFALLRSWRDADALASGPDRDDDAANGVRRRTVRVIRDYGMFDRREAPQYYPDVIPAPTG